MGYWWDSSKEERYWVEITDRDDVGADLHCPKTNENEKTYWSYDLIKQLQPGDIVFHYYTPLKSFIGASVVGLPLREKISIWIPHGTVGRSKDVTEHIERSGWSLPIYKYLQSENPLTLKKVIEPSEKDWIYQWIDNKEKEIEQRKNKGEKDLVNMVAAPFQRYGKNTGKNELRGQQGYLAKMPADFVNRWQELSILVDSLSNDQEEVEAINYFSPITTQNEEHLVNAKFSPKSAEEYIAFVKGGTQRRTRKHEKLISQAASFLQNKNATVSNPHPIDLLVTKPIKIIFEGKIVINQKPIYAVRQAIGQLHEYRYFLNHKDALLCILLDSQPNEELVNYIEQELGLLIAWMSDEIMHFGSVSTTIFDDL